MFNRESRKKNILKISFTSAITSGVNIVFQFSYRTVFLYILSKEYLGIEGLFANVINVLSLAELGIGVVIGYKLYEPIKNNNIIDTAALMNFYKKIYRCIAVMVAVLGLIMLPFLKYLVKDSSEIPDNVNLYVVYFLYLFQSISSYFFTYKQTLLTADQKGDIVVGYTFFNSTLKIVVQLVVLAVTKDYQLMLGIAILLNLLMNGTFSLYITKRYSEVFAIDAEIDKETKKSIYHDMRATMCHKIGGVLVGSTDNIILSACVGLGQLGIYSNYSLIIECVKKVLNQFLGNFTASLGNAYLSNSKQENYQIYKKFLIINFMFANIVSVCVYVLINPFIALWQGKDMILGQATLIVIVLQFFVQVVRIINISYTNACGLFNRDMARPIIEVAINLSTSIVLALNYGMIGVFIGTNVSYLCTVFWREPYLLYKYAFQENIKEYWVMYIKNFVLMIFECFIIDVFLKIDIDNFLKWILQSIITLSVSIILTGVFYKAEAVWLGKKLVAVIKSRRMTK